ncbi:MAG: PLP-dependent cysteine synthase family protein [Methanococcaceae archaeon]
MKYNESILDLIGRTPLIKLNQIGKDIKSQIFAKLESFNPGGSIKDRVAVSMIEKAEAVGEIKPGGTIIEATSGNTGIGLAIATAIKGYKSIFVLTTRASTEKISYLKALGAQVVIVPDSVKREDESHYLNVANRLAREIPNALFINQYCNPSNPEVHYKTTGPEIWEQTEGKITHFVASIGTGGTISGVGKYLKEKNPKIEIIGAEPNGSIFKEYLNRGLIGPAAPYLVEGIGQTYLPENVHFEYIDKIISVSDYNSFNSARQLSRKEGIFCGGSTGTNLFAALETAESFDGIGIIVFIVCDTGERYLSKFYNDDWFSRQYISDITDSPTKDYLHLTESDLAITETKGKE